MAQATDAEPRRVASACTSDHNAEMTPSHQAELEFRHLLRPTRHGPGGTLLDYSAFLFRAQVTVYRLGAKRFKVRQRKELQRHIALKETLRLNQQ